MKAWVTKYWENQGILEMEGEIPSGEPGMLVVGSHVSRDYFHGKEWHATLEAAKAHVEILRQRRIASLEAKCKRLREMTITVNKGRNKE